MRWRIFTLILLAGILFAGCSNTNTEQKEVVENTITQSSEIIIPDISNVSAAVAEQILVNAGLIPITEEIDSNNIAKGNVVNCSPEIGSSVAANSRITVYVSGGKCEIKAISWEDSSYNDRAEDSLFTCELKGLSIKDDILHLVCEVEPMFDGGIFMKHTFLGTGYVVCGYSPYGLENREIPITYTYDSKEIKIGEKQTLEFDVSMSSFEDKTIRSLEFIIETNINQPYLTDFSKTYDKTYKPFYLWYDIKWQETEDGENNSFN